MAVHTVRKSLRASRILSVAVVTTVVVNRSALLRADTSDSAAPTSLIVPALVATKTWDGTTSDYHSPHWSGTTTGVGDQLALNSGTVTAALASGQYISLSPTSTDGLSLAMSAGNLLLTDASGSGDSGLSVDKSTFTFSGGAIVASQEKIGLAGSASFVQSGGVNSVGTLTLATSAGSEEGASFRVEVRFRRRQVL